jgi:hypothetical protein
LFGHTACMFTSCCYDRRKWRIRIRFTQKYLVCTFY